MRGKNVSIYISGENLTWWEAHGSSAWVNEQITTVDTGVPTQEQLDAFPKHLKPTKAPLKATCEHYQPKGECLVKGCRYGRY